MLSVIALAGGREQEPSKEDEPDAIQAGVEDEGRVQPKSHHGVSNALSNAARDSRGFRIILGNPPDDGTEDAATVERKAGQQVESRQERIRTRKPGCRAR